MTPPAVFPPASPSPDAGANPSEELLMFLRECAAEMEQMATGPEELRGAAYFATALAAASPRTPEIDSPGTPPLPVLDQLGHVADTPRGKDFCRRIAPHLRWVPTTRGNDGGTDIALCWIQDAVMPSPDLAPELRAGITFMGANASYPLHRHPPHELYLTLAGTAAWRWGGSTALATVGPGQLLYNHPEDLHLMTTGAEPLLALWVLWE